MARVLLIDDDEHFRSYASALLERVGYSALIVSSGKAALAAIKSGRFDAIVTDLYMPDVDGFEIIRAVKAARLTTPIIGITGGYQGSAEHYSTAMIHFGAEAVFTKPIGEAAFLAALARAIARSQGPATKSLRSAQCE